MPCYWHGYVDLAGPSGLGPWPADVDRPWTCPGCGEQAVYHKASDRFFHADGSDTRECWRVILRGEFAGGGRDG
jgi:hypothetical protein